MSGRGSVAANPILIGAATVLVVIVAVFLAYNANAGLPFVPAYRLEIEAGSAANLVRGNEVRVGGARVGTVDAITAERRGNGRAYAVLSLKLEERVAPLPVDSTFLIRPKSVLGQKYVEVTRGTAERGWEDGARVPARQMRPDPVEFDEVTNMFDAETRAGIRGQLEGGGTALAGRGASLNAAIAAFRPLLEDVQPVLRTLAADDTDLAGFARGLGQAAAEVAPVAEQQASLVVALDRTLSAINEVSDAYEEAIAEGPATLDAAIASLPVQRPFLANGEQLLAELRPGVRALRSAAPDLAAALQVGQPTLRRAVALNRRLEPLFGAIRAFAEDPRTARGIARATELARELSPTLRFLAPAQTQCNYLALWFRNVASLLSDGDAHGTWQRFIIVATPQGPNNEGGPSARPANGPGRDNHFHVNPYPNTAAPGQPRECEAGNEVYLAGRRVLSNTPRTDSARTEGDPRPARRVGGTR